jgi:hypothetical protein
VTRADPTGGNQTIATMSRRKVLGGVAGVTAAVLLAMYLWPMLSIRQPVLNVVRVEPAEIIDDTGKEMSLVTFTISNPERRTNHVENLCFVGDSGRRIEAKVADRWIVVERPSLRLWGCQLGPGEKCEEEILLPTGTGACRLWLRYTGPGFSARLFRLAARLPLAVRRRLSNRFWRWANISGPSSHWREIRIELPLPPASALPVGSATMVGSTEVER